MSIRVALHHKTEYLNDELLQLSPLLVRPWQAPVTGACLGEKSEVHFEFEHSVKRIHRDLRLTGSYTESESEPWGLERRSMNGGGNHATLGAICPADSPVLRRAHLLGRSAALQATPRAHEFGADAAAALPYCAFPDS